MAAELHLFGYLACVLWLYTGRTADDWGYFFLGTALGAPFSPPVDTAITETDRTRILATPRRAPAHVTHGRGPSKGAPITRAQPR